MLLLCWHVRALWGVYPVSLCMCYMFLCIGLKALLRLYEDCTKTQLRLFHARAKGVSMHMLYLYVSTYKDIFEY